MDLHLLGCLNRMEFCEKFEVNSRFSRTEVSLGSHFLFFRGTCFFCKFGLRIFVDVSWKMLVLNAWRLLFVELSWRTLSLEVCGLS